MCIKNRELHLSIVEVLVKPLMQTRNLTINREHFRLSIVALEIVEISKQRKAKTLYYKSVETVYTPSVP